MGAVLVVAAVADVPVGKSSDLHQKLSKTNLGQCYKCVEVALPKSTSRTYAEFLP